ncbi:hypothetical protein F4778DRAFT_786113 [Xylariomycetidae sp. FL2044]|nr:hypothetical protein F4778DRAFT_786113 [Xylariomycetidae sp. FL2044]
MASTRIIFLSALAAAVSALSFEEYIPTCGYSCTTEVVDKSTTCDINDNACLCQYTYTIKRNGEVCYTDACSDADYGLVMKGWDEFCLAVGSSAAPRTLVKKTVPVTELPPAASSIIDTAQTPDVGSTLTASTETGVTPTVHPIGGSANSTLPVPTGVSPTPIDESDSSPIPTAAGARTEIGMDAGVAAGLVGGLAFLGL